jgi:PAS domain S-box-containing protein
VVLQTSATQDLLLAEEHAALRRLAILVARQASPDEVFTAVTEEVGSVLEADFAAMLTFADDRAVTVIASWSAAGPGPPIGTRLALDGDSVAVRINETGAPARMDSYADVDGETARFARDLGVGSTVGAPVLVDGKLWGALLAATRGREPLPETAEARLAAFTELVSTTISNAEARHELHRVGAEQEALQKAAVMVASGASPTEVFAVITESAAEVFGAPFASLIRVGAGERATMVAGCVACGAYVGTTWAVPAGDPGITRAVLDSSRPSRVEDHSRVHGPVGEAARALDLGSVAGAPVIVDGSIWGVLAVGVARTGPPLAPDAVERVANFAELVSTAIGNSEAHDQVRRLLDEQAALRRVATLVARGVSPAEVFAAVTDEVGDLFGSEAAIARFEPDGSARVVVGLTKGIPDVSIGDRWNLENLLASSAVYRTGRPARNDHTGHLDASGPIAENLRRMGFVSTVAAPVVVEGHLWGLMTVSDRHEPLPSDTEERVARFTELVATAIANAESRAELAASEARKSAVLEFALDCIITIDGDGKITEFNPAAEATFGYRREDVLGKYMAELIIPPTLREQHYRGLARYRETGEGALLRNPLELRGLRSDGTEFPVELSVTPVTVGDLVTFTGHVRDVTDRKRAEEEIARLLSGERAARSEAEAARERAQDLAREQAALRRVAVLVAEGASANELFAAVAHEVASVVGVPVVGVCRYEADRTFTMLGIAGEMTFTVGSRWPVDEEGLAGMILAAGRPARKDDYTTMPGPLGAAVRDDRMVATVGVPIVVDGVIWGFIVIAGRPDEAIPPDTEQRLARFTELVATAVSNATMRGELVASRARVLAAADDARRRIERDLHDGAQQRLVTLAVELRNIEARVPSGQDELRAEVSRLAGGMVTALDELREMSHGIHPANLSKAGLSAALRTLRRRSAIPVELDVRVKRRLAGYLEIAAYYIVSEALTNASKYSRAVRVWVDVGVEDGVLHVSIRDDGVGGADPRHGSGLIGLRDRVEALGGTIEIESPPGSGTRIHVVIPIPADHPIDSPRPPTGS